MVEECCLAKEQPRTTESKAQETFGAIKAMYISDLVQMQHHCEDTTFSHLVVLHLYTRIRAR